jgi:peptidoglycan biosynthesis protein MviN/MurJ (putative lipid II flippase)
VPIYTVMFTKLSKLFHNKDWQGINAHIDSSIVLIAITLIPCTVLLCSVGDVAIRLLYERVPLPRLIPLYKQGSFWVYTVLFSMRFCLIVRIFISFLV